MKYPLGVRWACTFVDIIFFCRVCCAALWADTCFVVYLRLGEGWCCYYETFQCSFCAVFRFYEVCKLMLVRKRIWTSDSGPNLYSLRIYALAAHSDSLAKYPAPAWFLKRGDPGCSVKMGKGAVAGIPDAPVVEHQHTELCGSEHFTQFQWLPCHVSLESGKAEYNPPSTWSNHP